ncbi:alkaline phosphatase [Halarcobacter ebronensis]|uniref:Alkaline phosphatase n=1 Tax=Halarcobacter ebronensis TaxID=1462615 RepID=A0A4Q0Y6L9_9BACT|nr:alkaline phosphatase PhoX [Halarcobacter ebronensis]RXJ65836.1 alkaline phosphatase [Halarcobacter ebronensis]
MKKSIISASVVTAAVLFSGCTTTQPSKAEFKPQSHQIEFSEVKVPEKEYEKRKIMASSSISVDGKKHKIGYNTILRSGDQVGEGVFGQLFDSKGEPLVGEDGAPKISNSNDFSSLIPVGDKLFMISQFETRPAAIYITELEQTEDGQLKALNTKNINLSHINGVWVPCAGSVTPWNTHLSSEEYEPDASAVKENGSINDYYDQMGEYYNGDLKALNPYDYGWTPEVKVLNEKGDVSVVKHYSMGRFAHELSYIMPDEKTVFLSDDGTNVAIYMFTADKAKDLSSGTLYAAKWIQTNDKGAGKADLQWINLGHSSDLNIKKALDAKIKFSDIFDKMEINKDGSCSTSSFTSVNTTTGAECLKVKEGKEEIASRMEARRYAAMLGATTEFRKMEGITYNPNENVVYLSMSEVAKGMEDNAKKGKYDIGGNNDIKLEANKCGTVYKLDLTTFITKAVDTKDNEINSQFVPRAMSGLVSGFADKSVAQNKCSVTSLANPDNITYIPNTDTLIIGEDTGSGHQNDYIWSYNTKTDKLTRIQTTPYGSETTSAYYYNNIGGYGYLMSVVQHPYGEGDATTKEEDMPSKAYNVSDMKAYTGYIGPLPVISK